MRHGTWAPLFADCLWLEGGELRVESLGRLTTLWYESDGAGASGVVKLWLINPRQGTKSYSVPEAAWVIHTKWFYSSSLQLLKGNTSYMIMAYTISKNSTIYLGSSLGQ